MIDPKWIDQGFITPRANQGTQNGILYTALYRALLLASGYSYDVRILDPLKRCEITAGLYKRNPTSTLQESWDDYLGLAVLASMNGAYRYYHARKILRYGLLHFGFFNTTGKFRWDSWLWRYPQLWALMVPAAYPCLIPLYRPYLKLIARFMNADHPGGIILDWLWFYGLKELGIEHPKYKALCLRLPEAVRDQFDHDHPVVELADRLSDKERR